MDRKALKALAKDKLSGNWGVAILALLVASLATAAASAVFGLLELVVIGPFSVSLAFIFASIVRGQKRDFDDVFFGFKHFANNFITGLLVSIFTTLWSLLFVIPGIVKSYAYAMTYYIQADHPEMTETDAITASRKMMQGHKWELFVLDLSFIGWYLLASLTFGVLLFYVIPYHNAARAAFYDALANNGVAAETASETTEAVVEQPAETSAVDDSDPFGDEDNTK